MFAEFDYSLPVRYMFPNVLAPPSRIQFYSVLGIPESDRCS
jgi:hypothetical protein